MFHTLTCKVFVRNLFRATGSGKFSPNLGLLTSDIGFVQQFNDALPSFGNNDALIYLNTNHTNQLQSHTFHTFRIIRIRGYLHLRTLRYTQRR